MSRDELLRARGWVQHGAGLDLWQPPWPEREEWLDRENAIRAQEMRDSMSVNAHGSARFYPTAEQAQTSPLLAACAARGMCERDVIGMLFAESEERMKHVQRLAAMQPPAPIHITADEGGRVMAAILKRTEETAAAWKAYGLAWARNDGAGVVKATGALFALGIAVDPDEPAKAAP